MSSITNDEYIFENYQKPCFILWFTPDNANAQFRNSRFNVFRQRKRQQSLHVPSVATTEPAN